MESILPSSLIDFHKTDLHSGLFKIIEGIKNEFEFTQRDLSKILHRPPTTISNWFEQKLIKVSKEGHTPDDAQIYELIELYDSLTSYFVHTQDQKAWLTTAQQIFENLSPIAYMQKHPAHLREVRKYLDRRINP
jgi:hypothetical protein